MTLRLIAALLILSTLTACATYVNIPPQARDVAEHDPNDRKVVEVIALAYEKLLDESPMNERFQVILPKGTTAETYKAVLPRFGKLALWSSDGRAKDVPVIEVSQVRIRGTHAEVDLIQPVMPTSRRAVPQVATVFLDHDLFSGWYARRVRYWQGAAVEAALTPDPMPAPVPAGEPTP